ncbi:MAG: tetratricopeptide repeat protein, partial [Anaerolineales bacterium]
MLETIRQYAQEKLAAGGESELAYRQHLAYYLALAEVAASELRGPRKVDWLNRLDRENDNLRVALGWAIQQAEAESALQLASAMAYFWIIRSSAAEGRRWLAAALHLPASLGSPGTSAWRARALLGAGWLELEKDPSPSRPWADQALDIYRELGDKAGMAFALWLLAGQRRLVKDYAGASQHYAKALDLWTAAGDRWGAGICLHQMGHAALEMGDSARAQEFYQRSVEIWREVGDRGQWLWALSDLAFRVWMDGDSPRARAILEESLAAFGELEDGFWIGMLSHLTYILIALGDFPRASATARSFHYVIGGQRSNAMGQVYLGQIALLQGRLSEAQAILAGALQSFQDLNQPDWSHWISPWLAAGAYRQGDLQRARALIHDDPHLIGIDDPERDGSDKRFPLLVLGDVARMQGQPAIASESYARSLKILVHDRNQPDMAPPLEGFAKLAAMAAQPLRAARLFGAAQALRGRIGLRIPPVEQPDYDAAVAQTRAQ